MTAQHVAPYPLNDVWIVDTWAPHHMTSDVNNLTQATPFEGSNMIKIGNGQCFPIKHIGSTFLKTPSHTLKLTKVLHVP